MAPGNTKNAGQLQDLNPFGSREPQLIMHAQWPGRF